MGTVVGNSLNGEARLVCPALFNNQRFLNLVRIYPNPDYLYQLILNRQLTNANFQHFGSQMPGINRRTGLPYNTSLNEHGQLRLDFDFDATDVTIVDKFKYIKAFMLLNEVTIALESEALLRQGEQAIEVANLGKEVKELSNLINNNPDPSDSLIEKHAHLLKQYRIKSGLEREDQPPQSKPQIYEARSNQTRHHRFFRSLVQTFFKDSDQFTLPGKPRP